MRNVIKVTGNNRKAVIDFLNEYMKDIFKPCNQEGFIVHEENCYIEVKGSVFFTHTEYIGPTKTLKQVKELYNPKETEREKSSRARAQMYKLKYEECKKYSLSKEDVIDELESKLSISNDLYMSEKKDVVRLTELCDQNEKEIYSLKKEKASLAGQLRHANIEHKKLKKYFYISLALIILTPTLVKWIG